ncbi:hypothetical protein LNN38_24830 [Pseudomonas sp. LA21]|uniref:hypothetical protein n=1 Tax=unclassified Pseudomonas TaxID=196821 RepID=UPI001A9CBB35|nr:MULTISPECIES: hypothetical protein [unclassified Pseudomonas]MCJ1888100.1 hypothetical protein [Pseudomonas sp. LA21]
MKKLIVLLLVLCAAHLYVGFYKTRWAEDNKRVFFIKKYPSLQVEFVNLFASDADDKPLDQLSPLERATVRDYCKYRLGIETELKTQTELDACKER